MSVYHSISEVQAAVELVQLGVRWVAYDVAVNVWLVPSKFNMVVNSFWCHSLFQSFFSIQRTGLDKTLCLVFFIFILLCYHLDIVTLLVLFDFQASITTLDQHYIRRYLLSIFDLDEVTYLDLSRCYILELSFSNNLFNHL
jgi:hypothetical protein